MNPFPIRYHERGARSKKSFPELAEASGISLTAARASGKRRLETKANAGERSLTYGETLALLTLESHASEQRPFFDSLA